MKALLASIVSFVLVFSLAGHAFAAPVSKKMAEKAVQWRIKQEKASNSNLDRIIDTFEIYGETNNTATCYIATLSPQGYMVIAGDDIFAPCLLYSFEESSVNIREDPIFLGIVRTIEIVMKHYFADNKARAEVPDTHTLWFDILGERKVDFAQTQYGPLMSDISFHQYPPYGSNCPYVQDKNGVQNTTKRNPVGCVATSVMQIMKYWNTKRLPHFSDEDWGNISAFGSTITPGNRAYHGLPSISSINANVSEKDIDYSDNGSLGYLGIAVGLLCHMDYVWTKSGNESAACHDITARELKKVFPTAQYYFGMFPASAQDRMLELIKENISCQQPVVLGITRHSVVVDGWREGEIHINYGWANYDNTTKWYAINCGLLFKYIVNVYDKDRLLTDIIYDIAPVPSIPQRGCDARNSYESPLPAPSSAPENLKFTLYKDTARGYRQQSGGYVTYSVKVEEVAVDGMGNIVVAFQPATILNDGYPCGFWVFNDRGTFLRECMVNEEDTGWSGSGTTAKGDVILVASEGAVYRVSGTSSEKVFQIDLPDGDRTGAVKVTSGNNIFVTTRSKIWRIDVYNKVGASWTLPSGYLFYHDDCLAYDEGVGRLFAVGYSVSADANRVYKISAATMIGEQYYLLNNGDYSNSTVGIDSAGNVYVGYRRWVYKFANGNLATNSMSSVEVTSEYRVDVCPVVASAGTVYITAFDDLSYNHDRFGGFLKAVDSSDMSIKWDDDMVGNNDGYEDRARVPQSVVGANGICIAYYLYRSADGAWNSYFKGFEDRQEYGYQLWQVHLSGDWGLIGIGPGQTIYVRSGNRIACYSPGSRGDAYDAGMGFENNDAPDVPVVSIAGGNVLDYETGAVVTWTCADKDNNNFGDDGDSSGLKYSVYLTTQDVGEDSPEIGIIDAVATELDERSFTLTGLQSSATYSLYVVASDGQDTTNSERVIFTTTSAPVVIILDPNAVYFGSDGATASVTVENENDDPFVPTGSSSQPWCSVSVSSFPNNGQIEISVSPNMSVDDRSCIVTVGAVGETAVAYVTVTQDGRSLDPAELSVTPLSLNFASSGGSKQVVVSNYGEASMNWLVFEDCSWLSVSSTSGTDDGSFGVTVLSNSSGTSRQYTITIGANALGSPKQITVYQEGALPTHTPTPTPTPSVQPSASGGGGGCFVATAAFGSYAVSELTNLSEIRDSLIMGSNVGNEVIGLYYSVSPAMVERLRESESSRLLIRRLID